MDFRKLSSVLYSNELDVKKFENLLSNNDQGYKFFWLEAILKLISQNRQLFTFEDVIDEMIVGAWRMVTYYHLRLGHTVNGNTENFLEHAIRILSECSKEDIGNKTPSKDRLLFLIKKYQDNLMEDKLHLVKTATHRRCGKVLTNIPMSQQKWISHQAQKADIKSDFHITGQLM